jgi:hypothetical protein
MSTLSALIALADELANEGAEGEITVELPTSAWMRLSGEIAQVVVKGKPCMAHVFQDRTELVVRTPLLDVRVLLPLEMADTLRRAYAHAQLARTIAAADVEPSAEPNNVTVAPDFTVTTEWHKP